MKGLIPVGIPVCIVAQKGVTMKLIKKYRSLAIDEFILNNDNLAAKVKETCPELNLTLSITRAPTLQELQAGNSPMCV